MCKLPSNTLFKYFQPKENDNNLKLHLQLPEEIKELLSEKSKNQEYSNKP